MAQAKGKQSFFITIFSALCMLGFSACSSNDGPREVTFGLTAVGQFLDRNLTDTGQTAMQFSTTGQVQACAFACTGQVNTEGGDNIFEIQVPFIPGNGCDDAGPVGGAEVTVIDEEALTAVLEEGETVNVCIECNDLSQALLQNIRTFSGCQTFLPVNGDNMTLTTPLEEGEIQILENVCGALTSTAIILHSGLCGLFGGEEFLTVEAKQGIVGDDDDDGPVFFPGGIDAAICRLSQEQFVNASLDALACPRCGNGVVEKLEQCEAGLEDLCGPGLTCDSFCSCRCDFFLPTCEDAQANADDNGEECNSPEECCQVVFGGNPNLTCDENVIQKETSDDPGMACCAVATTCGNFVIDEGEECDVGVDLFFSGEPDPTQCGGDPFACDPFTCRCGGGGGPCNFNGICDENESPDCEDCNQIPDCLGPIDGPQPLCNFNEECQLGQVCDFDEGLGTCACIDGGGGGGECGEIEPGVCGGACPDGGECVAGLRGGGCACVIIVPL